MEKRIRAAVVTVSTRSSAGERKDRSGPALCELVEKTIGEVIYYSVVTDRANDIRDELLKICDELHADIVFTLGGTGLSPSDVTPEATESVLERKVPGIVEAIRVKSLKITDRAMLSRAVSGVRKSTLIINLPGSEKAVKESFDIIRAVLGHAVELIHGAVSDCGRTDAEKFK